VNAEKFVATVAPSLGPAIVTVFGTDVPILALVLSGAGLLLARVIAPPPLRKLSRAQHWALTVLLLIILFLIVTGSFTGEPLEPGMAVIWGVGLGFSGLVAVEFFADRTIAMLKAMFGGQPNA
jgi:hypothetical protein